ncbi:MAG: hypothetical protein JJE52_11625 [Acidimicrobiia bacterium]|nr:hypothetical protein [Acidimicrobiia bacterium]
MSPTDPRVLAAHGDPALLLRQLGRCPVHVADDGSYVVARPDDVDDVLGRPSATISFVPDPGDAISGMQALMARFSDGEDHRRRRALTEEVIAWIDPGRVRSASGACVDAALGGGGTIDLAPLARRVPVEVLAEALGLDDVPTVVQAIDLLCRRLAPMLGPVTRPDDATVCEALTAAFGLLDESAVALVAVLFQAMDATAALIAQMLVSPHAPALVLTNRVTVAAMRIGGADLRAGARIVIALGAATAASGCDRSFGRSVHRCPGEALARAIADGFVDAVRASGRTLADGAEDLTWETRPNLRLPAALHLR